MPHSTEQPHTGDDVGAHLARQAGRYGPDGLSRISGGQPAFGFRADGCIDQLKAVHQSYLSGSLTDEQCWQIDKHLLSCRRCENHWDALSSELEESFPRQVRDAEGEGLEDAEAETEADFHRHLDFRRRPPVRCLLRVGREE